MYIRCCWGCCRHNAKSSSTGRGGSADKKTEKTHDLSSRLMKSWGFGRRRPKPLQAPKTPEKSSKLMICDQKWHICHFLAHSTQNLSYSAIKRAYTASTEEKRAYTASTEEREELIPHQQRREKSLYSIKRGEKSGWRQWVGLYFIVTYSPHCHEIWLKHPHGTPP